MQWNKYIPITAYNLCLFVLRAYIFFLLNIDILMYKSVLERYNKGNIKGI